MSADPFLKANATYLNARRLGCQPLSLAFGEVAETGRARMKWHDYLAFVVLVIAGLTLLAWVAR